MKKIKDLIIVIEFILVLLTVLMANILKKDDEISLTERRKLATFPKFNIDSLVEGIFCKELDNYVQDQFIKRDSFREIKYFFSSNVYRNLDDNKMFVKNGKIYKMEYPLNEKAVNSQVKKLKDVSDKYLNGMNIYYSIIPDKVYYLNDNHLKLNYEKIENTMKENFTSGKYIDIKSSLTVEDFYNTDLHWKQECLNKTVDVLKDNMGLEKNNIEYQEKIAGKLYGSYYGHVAAKVEIDNIKYLTNDIIDNATVYNVETKKYTDVYDLQKYNTSKDKYDLFLSGSSAVLKIENNKCNSDKELIIFRDSFGSSITPFFIENYKKITLIDLRYINSKILDKYVKFENQDVLFLYSGTVLNQENFL